MYYDMDHMISFGALGMKERCQVMSTLKPIRRRMNLHMQLTMGEQDLLSYISRSKLIWTCYFRLIELHLLHDHLMTSSRRHGVEGI